MYSRIALAFVAFAIGVTASAQQPVFFERVLLPITIPDEVPGAFGSRWVTHISITNTADREITIRGYLPAPCAFSPCVPSFAVPPNVTFFPTVNPGKVTQGAVLLVEQPFASQVATHLRAQDVSRDSQTWGTEIPVVREARLFQSAFDLPDVPVTAGFRQTLRIYDVNAIEGASVVVRFYKIDPTVAYPTRQINPQPAADTLLAERVIPLQTEQRPESPTFDLGYAEISSLDGIGELQGAERLRIRVAPSTSASRLWALVSITNNDTQHVTLITPAE